MPNRAKERKRARLAGEAVLRRARTDPQFAAVLRGILDASITGKRNRALLGLRVAKPASQALRSREAQRAVFAELGVDPLLGQ